jgi:hypothetical protein
MNNVTVFTLRLVVAHDLAAGGPFGRYSEIFGTARTPGVRLLRPFAVALRRALSRGGAPDAIIAAVLREGAPREERARVRP